MLFSYEWLKELIDDIPTPQELLEQLTMHSVEVEDVIEHGNALGNVVVGEVLSITSHPDADKLHIGQFDVGEAQPRQIVFGSIASLSVGHKIPVALSPTVITGGVKIKERKLRGELSQGMCCLNSELSILDGAQDVHRFDSSVQNGTPIVDVLQLNETVIDIDNKSMTHRADLFSHATMAREIAAVFGLDHQQPQGVSLPTNIPQYEVTLEDTDACLRYIALECSVTVGPSPDFIVRRLQTCGIKSINNVVDITNYVMLELGEPTHAFDADTISGDHIVVRRARQGEELRTLDHETKTLSDSVLVIADEEKPLAVAGVIGGEHSAVTDQTTRILLEVANFEPLMIRKAGQHVGLRTEGLLRWEKGLSPELASIAAQRALYLLQEYAGATCLRSTDVYPQPQQPWTVMLSQQRLTALSGMVFEPKQVIDYLERLECTVRTKGRGDRLVYHIRPPWFRLDLKLPEDIIEEVVRLYGVNNIPLQQLYGTLHVGETEASLPLMSAVRQSLASNGLYETYHYSFYGDAYRRDIGGQFEEQHVELLNPLSDDLRYLRISTVPRLLDTVARNQSLVDDASYFEIGHVYFDNREVIQLGCAVVGGDDPYRRLRGTMETLYADLHIAVRAELISSPSEQAELWAPYDQDNALGFFVGSQLVGTIGLARPDIADAHGVSEVVAVGVCSLTLLESIQRVSDQVQPLSSYPAIELDLSFLMDQSVQWAQVELLLREDMKELLQHIRVFDVYTGEGIPSGKKSISCRLLFQSSHRTLTMDELETWRDAFVKKAQKTLGISLREV